MTSIDDTTAVRLTGRRGLLAAVPAMLGFYPKESLVMMCLSGPRRRVGPVIRVDLLDLTPPAGRPALPIALLQQHAHQHSDEVALICYSDRAEGIAGFDEAVIALAAGGVVVLDAVVVRGGGPPDPSDPQVLAMTVTSVGNGRAILPNRQALRDCITGPTGPAAVTAAAGVHAAAGRLRDMVGTAGPIEKNRLQQLIDETVDTALRDVVGPAGVSSDTSAMLAILASHVTIRDALVGRAVNDLDAPWVPMLIAVAAAIPDEDAAEICAVLSVAAYRRGDGALAQVAVDRALAGEPDHRLAGLMLEVMAAGLPPERLVDLTPETAG